MAKKLTQIDYETKITNRFPHIVVYGEYIDYNEPIWHYCLIHWRAFELSPRLMLSKGRKGCLECSNMEKWTYKRLKKELALICFPDGTPKFLLLTPEADFIRDFDGVKTEIRLRCTLDRYEWVTTINNLINVGTGCSRCCNTELWTYMKLVTELALLCFPDGTPRFLLLTSEADFNENYKGVETRIRLRCSKDGYEWDTTIKNVVHKGSGCSRCSGKEEWTYQRLQESISNLKFPDGTPKFLLLTPEADFIRDFDGVKTRIRLRCNKDQYEWETSINSLINGESGCSRCSGKEEWSYLRLQEAILGLKFPDGSQVCTLEMSEADFLKAYEKYGVNTKIHVRCTVDKEHTWSPRLNDLINNKSGCPHCNTIGYSKAEIEWLEFVMRTEGIYIQHAKNGGQILICGRSVDGMCYETNSVYQFHGDFWHGNPVRFDQNKIHPKYKEKGLTYGDKYKETLIKDQELRDQGYNVIIMWEAEWKEIKKKLN